MRIKEGYKLREANGHFAVVAVGKAAGQFFGVINLNRSGALLWKRLENGCSESGLINFLLETYEVNEETAQADVKQFIKTLAEVDILEL